MEKELIIVGDRVLLKPVSEEDKTETGLYLPQGVKEREKIGQAHVVKVGPGYPVPDPGALEIEPWQASQLDSSRYFPLQAKEGDYCLYLKNAAVEVMYEDKKYLVAPHSAILLLVRNKL
jgi:chaperonin GroES